MGGTRRHNRRSVDQVRKKTERLIKEHDARQRQIHLRRKEVGIKETIRSKSILLERVRKMNNKELAAHRQKRLMNKDIPTSKKKVYAQLSLNAYREVLTGELETIIRTLLDQLPEE